ncbi:MAG: hypothetical protein AB7F59_08410 [Bdellovibrionales bacterium]
MNPFEKFRDQMLEAVTLFQQENSPSWLMNWIKEHEKVLADRYPLTKKCLREAFSPLMLDYWAEFPQAHWSLEFSCSLFPLFLKERVRLRKVPRYLAELAEFEWTLHWVPIDPTVEKVERQKVRPGCYALNPVTKIFRFEHRVYQFYWDMMLDESAPETLPENVEPEPEAELLILSRDPEKFKVEITEANLLQAAVIDLLLENAFTEDDIVQNCQRVLVGSETPDVQKAIASLVKNHVIWLGV